MCAVSAWRESAFYLNSRKSAPRVCILPEQQEKCTAIRGDLEFPRLPQTPQSKESAAQDVPGFSQTVETQTVKGWVRGPLLVTCSACRRSPAASSPNPQASGVHGGSAVG